MSTGVNKTDYGGASYDADYADHFREHYEQNYADTDADFAQYEPAYRFGYELAGSYNDRDWQAIEHDARNQWQERYGDDSAWDDVKDAVKASWRHVRDNQRSRRSG